MRLFTFLFYRASLMAFAATYSNTENHPATIRLRSAAQKKERAEAEAARHATVPPPAAKLPDDGEGGEDGSSGSETEREGPRITIARPKGESTEERRARKSAVKADRAVRFCRRCPGLLNTD